ncbi:DUF6804 family protein [Microbacterium imperiale]|uniref:Uncharacterized protein n=1 Tax=Microbacterium imperiale TaxID=33884 RepID=A0A9W6HHA8_9MICO|nr:DUF6804 family protein [Microbacterium imperiale]MBP2420674.1 putative MnhB-related membrane protein [Microbacterium imperiale]MDS0200495.1 hypothetical protein [Microbacterium imperiale]BFE41014.1 hypothetical protein GCM10017544_19700 [Microbacterium imperiale]GLJ80019.1 hypothetical protein GCM10017586_17020 [Microbacterium imperiale]
MASRTARPTDPPLRQRNALAPGILGAATLVAGMALIGGDVAVVVSFIVTILALIIAWFAVQARQWWWAVVMAAIAIVWNPVVPFSFAAPIWLTAHVIAAAAFLAAGALIWTERSEPAP